MSNGGIRNRDWTRVALGLAAPLLAIVFSVVVTSLILFAAGDPVALTWRTLATGGLAGALPRNLVNTVNLATTYYLSAVAVAIGFRMNLFNIGVDGQYRLAAMLAAAVGGAWALPRGRTSICGRRCSSDGASVRRLTTPARRKLLVVGNGSTNPPIRRSVTKTRGANFSGRRPETARRPGA